MKILLVEDDDALIALLTRSLNSQHHIVDAVKDGEMGWTYASTFDYDSIVLDIMLPKLDGISLCKRLRGAGDTTPILLLTAQDNITAKVQGLDAGADDYVVKPFDLAELSARVRALLRRGSTNPLPLLTWGDLMLNPSTCEVTYDGRDLILTTKEYDLLELFLKESDRVFSSNEIIDRLWSSDAFPTEATVRSHLRRLRHKLQAAGAPADAIGTIHGRGYYLKSPQQTYPHPLIPAHPAATIHELSIPVEDSQPQKAEYLAFLQETWVKTKPQCLQTLTELTAIVDRLVMGTCTYPEQQQAHQQAHKLVGTLGVFCLLSAMEIARQIEASLCAGVVGDSQRASILPPTAAAMLQPLLGEMAREIAENLPSQTIKDVSPQLPAILLIDLDPNLTLSLTAMANDRGYGTVTLSTIAAAESYLSTIPAAPNRCSPTVVAIGMRAQAPSAADPLFSWIHTLHRRFPDWSLLVLGERDESTAAWRCGSPATPDQRLRQRLTVARNGGKFLETAALTTTQIFTALTSSLQFDLATVKVMVVDDDLDWLRALPKLLQPWGMKITTLADPQQFWAVLQAVQPDVLV